MKRVIAIAILLQLSVLAYCCTTFVLKDKDKLVFGRNLDWVSDDGLVVINKRGVSKTSLVFPPEKPVKWTSLWGSVTFNQFGKEFPYGGINEKGLVVEIMRVAGSYPKPDDRAAVNELQWIQYQLDNATTIDDVIRSDQKIRISKVNQNLHFLVCDKRGGVAVIEFTRKGMLVYKENDLPVSVLENDPYSKSLTNYKEGASCRFTTAANMVKLYDSNSGSMVDYSFQILDRVALQGSWSIVYDIQNMEIHFKTKSLNSIRSIDISAFNFDCKAPSLLYDLLGRSEKEVNESFVAYSDKLNKKKFYAGIKSNQIGLPQQIITVFANYNNSCTCTQ
ncbi:MAG: hypothetical protein CL840_18515 [Crocinitomicaceae bacterium]|nr:hypothetical protein [Crocinitomicaceae bacterium]|tara:strand:- start:19839 stop:20840 length:1002 start_codon:yes stop_codon:yes gene_type:complete